MLQKYNKYKVLKIFFEDPKPEGIGFQLREISRKIKLAPVSVKNYLEELEKEGMIKKSKHRIHKFPVYYANRENEKFLFYKKIDNIITLEESGLIDYLDDECTPDTIILFGSAARGEDLKNSDIDLFLQCEERDLNLKTFEKKINRKINPFFSENFNKLSKELKNNILNGIILKGYLKIF